MRISSSSKAYRPSESTSGTISPFLTQFLNVVELVFASRAALPVVLDFIRTYFSLWYPFVSRGTSHRVAPHYMNPYDGLGLDELLELEEEAEANEARLAPVLIDGDERVEGPAAIARKLAMSRRALAYGLSKLYPELAFIWQDVGPKPESMATLLQNVRGVIVETIAKRVRQEQQDRGRARGQANKRPQMWHLSGPRRSDDD